MEMQIREYQKQDFQPLKEIIRSTWHYDEFSSPETASRQLPDKLHLFTGGRT